MKETIEYYYNIKIDIEDLSYAKELRKINKNVAVFCLKKSSAIRESYEKHTLIANRKVEATPVQAYIEEASDVEEVSDDDMDLAGF